MEHEAKYAVVTSGSEYHGIRRGMLLDIVGERSHALDLSDESGKRYPDVGKQLVVRFQYFDSALSFAESLRHQRA